MNDYEKILRTSATILNGDEFEILKQLIDYEFEQINLLDNCRSPAGYFTLIDENLVLIFANSVLKLISNNAVLELENIPFSNTKLRSTQLIEIVLESYKLNIVSSLIMEYKFFSATRQQFFNFKLIPVQNKGLVFFLDDIDQKTLLNKRNPDQESQIIFDKIRQILTRSNISYSIINSNLTVIDSKINSMHSKLLKRPEELYNLIEPKKSNFLASITNKIINNEIQDFQLNKLVKLDNQEYILQVNCFLLSEQLDELILIFDLKITNGRIYQDDNFKIKLEPEKILPQNTTIDMIQRKAIKYMDNFTILFDRFYKERKYLDLNYAHEYFSTSMKDRQFDVQHFIKFYLALILSSPLFMLTRKELIKILVDSNIISYSIFAKIFPSINDNEENIIYDRNGKICILDEVKTPLIELLIESFGLMNEISLELKTKDFQIDSESEFILDVAEFYENNSLSVNEKINKFKENYKEFNEFLKKIGNNNHEKTLNLFSIEIPWYYGLVVGHYSKPFKINFIPSNNGNENYFFSHGEINDREFMVGTTFPENDKEWEELIIILNLKSVITPKVKSYLNEKKIIALSLNYYLPKYPLDDSNYFVDINFNSNVILDLKKQIKKIEPTKNIKKIHIFSSVDFDMGIKLGHLSLDLEINCHFYCYNPDKFNFFEIQLE